MASTIFAASLLLAAAPKGMLDKDSLSQLKQLKQQIEDNKEFAEGVIKATQRKFGFLVTDDGREIYLSPEEMLKAFPDDRVRILVTRSEGDKSAGTKAAREKVSGRIEKILKPGVAEFTGRYVVKGKGHFVEPDLPRNNRWIFLPPAARKNAKPGDLIACKLARHPFPQGKPQAKVLRVIGPESAQGIAADYMIARFDLEPEWPKDWQKSLLAPDPAARTDLSAVAFVTIDAPGTQDMDDALYAEPTDSGWQLSIAIADVAALVAPGTELDKLAQRRATSVYLPGRPVPMLPPALAVESCSLLAGLDRPALVCNLNLASDGQVLDCSFQEATIASRAKLSYEQVACYLDSQQADAEVEPHTANLDALKNATAALLARRRADSLVIAGRQEFKLVLNEQGKLDHIEELVKNSAHSLVEECMVAVNRCAAEWIGDRGLFIEHPGFRPERLPDVRKLADEFLGLKDVAFESSEGYTQLMKAIDDETLAFPLRAVLSRLLERSRLSLTPRPHQGMGLARYTTVTSPIRKYSDLLCQRMIKARLRQQSVPQLANKLIEALERRLDNARQARYQMEQWLKCEYLEPLQGQTLPGVVTQVNSNGFTVRLDQHLVEGFVETRQLQEKFSFDPMRLRLKSDRCTIELHQAVNVTIASVDRKQRSIRFQLALPTEATAASTSVAEA